VTNWSLRGELRAIHNSDQSLQDYLLLTGLQYSFGGKSTATSVILHLLSLFMYCLPMPMVMVLLMPMTVAQIPH
jgi:hypothetical protein